jgi:hypothetical protein
MNSYAYTPEQTHHQEKGKSQRGIKIAINPCAVAFNISIECWADLIIFIILND